MGLFSTKESSSANRRTSSDAQIREMRSRARRRLIGALVLVLGAILVVPFLTSNEPEPEQNQMLAVIPTPPAIQPPEQLAQAPAAPNPQPLDPVQDEADTLIDSPAILEPEVTAPLPEPEESPPPKVPEPKPAPTPAPKPAAEKPAEPKRPSATERTDDGAVALALLEGRTPPTTARATPAAAPKGNFILQIVAYSSETEAQSRRNQLVSAGVTNAYVETANSGGKATYRLRVGPFPTREAAQAAQTRLRSLGYENSFISTK
ncbi:SPOR domain-containing protein [Paenalcaligenes niemegkensis]|uniref:SPOR domain-containing protein n=1 Tax=Paenalcaligenes niemegkensis TaxID=2895469 RepID=UPI001EE787C2|nr:SPOR domain-containing protein [Paenalcaligenes niemegkensis]MCQ9616279.1 SPOR domain-containing protein [Paenalcaligenes niemegkensis]